MKKILLVFGTRPEAIKMAPLCRALRAHPTDFHVRICVTAQHRGMLDQVLRVFDLCPDVDLDLMKPGQDLYDVTAGVLTRMREVLTDERPDIVLVHGDTTTAFATALAAFYADIAVGHVEAGLRTGNLRAPFPEEMNRRFVGQLAVLHFAPTEQSATNLRGEGAQSKHVFVTGNTVIDALQWVIRRFDSEPQRVAALLSDLGDVLGFNLRSQTYVLITGHRRENFGDGFTQIVTALAELASRYPEIHFVYPVHLNPSVDTPVRERLSNISNIHLIPPQEYLPFTLLLRHCRLVLTDSGGIQEEAPSLGKPVLVMRDVTERPEAVKTGTVRLVGADKRRICDGVAALIEDGELYRAMSLAQNPYGDGQACERIVTHLREFVI